MRCKYSYYELKFYVFFVFTKSFDIPCKFVCLNSDTTNRKHCTLQGLIEAGVCDQHRMSLRLVISWLFNNTIPSEGL